MGMDESMSNCLVFSWSRFVLGRVEGSKMTPTQLRAETKQLQPPQNLRHQSTMALWHHGTLPATGPSNLPGRIALPAKPGSFGPEVDLEPRGTSRHPRPKIPKIPSDHSAFSQTEMFAMVLRTSSVSSVSYDSSRCAQIVVLRTLISGKPRSMEIPLSSTSFNFHKGTS